MTDLLHLNDQIAFAGLQSHNRIPSWMAASTSLCLPSIHEGCPNVVLESLACGLPVGSSRVGGVPDSVTESNGVLVPPADPLALTEALARNWDRGTIARLAQERSWDVVADDYWTAFRQIIDPSGSTEA